jgi:KAP family P-loop domain
VSIIRKDFQQLVELMADWRENPEADGLPRRPMDRIVLYIDDLDRCSPRQVVKVLEAVHLLLALDLFVVVVGVDPRWLLRLLASHYEEILAEGGDWQMKPEDYLEKIINVPLVLPGMSAGGLERLLRSMDQEGGLGDPGDLPELPTERTIAEVLDPPDISIERGSEVDLQQGTGRPQPPRPLTEAELTLLAKLDSLIETPREAKRLFNLYRMLRATRDLSDVSRFLGDDGRAGEFQAVAVLHRGRTPAREGARHPRRSRARSRRQTRAPVGGDQLGTFRRGLRAARRGCGVDQSDRRHAARSRSPRLVPAPPRPPRGLGGADRARLPAVGAADPPVLLRLPAHRGPASGRGRRTRAAERPAKAV